MQNGQYAGFGDSIIEQGEFERGTGVPQQINVRGCHQFGIKLDASHGLIAVHGMGANHDQIFAKQSVIVEGFSFRWEVLNFVKGNSNFFRWLVVFFGLGEGGGRMP
ncbi:MAG: hypothetical protein L6Q40_00055 [Azonexus sp.]|nr:hypothetical protein [Azonexus sp.]